MKIKNKLLYYIQKMFFPKYKETFKRDDVSLFFKEIEKRAKTYLQVTFLRPDILIESNDTYFNNIELYNCFKNISDDEKYIFYNSIKMYEQKYVNSFYITINDYISEEGKNKKIQPITFSIWYLGGEVRAGCFFNPEYFKKMKITHNDVFNKAKEHINIFNGNSFLFKENNIDRNNFILIEAILSSKKERPLLDDQEFVDYISQTFANFVSNFSKYYFENKKRES